MLSPDHSGFLNGSELEESHHMVTGVTEEIRNRHHMVTGITEEIRNRHHLVAGVPEEIGNRHHMVTGVTEEIRNGHHKVTRTQEDIPYCSSGSSSAKQKKASSTSQPQFRCKNTPKINEADQILLALQQVATNSNSANFNNNINRISKMPKSLTTTISFDGKSDRFELFQDLLQTSLKFHNQLTEEDTTNFFYSLNRVDALQTFKHHEPQMRSWEEFGLSQWRQQNTGFNDWCSIWQTGTYLIF